MKIIPGVDGVPRNRMSFCNAMVAPDERSSILVPCRGLIPAGFVLIEGGKTLSLNLEEKKAVVTELGKVLGTAQTIVVAEYRGMGVVSMTGLRAKARANGVYLRVLKNTLVRRALAGTTFAGLAEQLVGPLVYGISVDPVAAAKVLSEFAKANEKLVIKAGAMPNFVMSAKDVMNLANMPSRDELLAKLMGTMQAPVTQFVRTLNEVPTKLVRGLAAVRDKQAV